MVAPLREEACEIRFVNRTDLSTWWHVWPVEADVEGPLLEPSGGSVAAQNRSLMFFCGVVVALGLFLTG